MIYKSGYREEYSQCFRLFFQSKPLNNEMSLKASGLQDKSHVTCQLPPDPDTTFKVNISYQSIGRNRKRFDVNKSTVVKNLLEQYLKAIYGTQYQPYYLTSLALFFKGKPLDNDMTLEKCGVERTVEVICKKAPVPSRKVTAGIVFEEDESTADYLTVTNDTTLSFLLDQYLVVVSFQYES